MRIPKWLAAAALTCLFATAHAESSCEAMTDQCAAKLCEIDAALETARKEGRMRKVATLKDLRVDALRCSSKPKSD